MKDRVSAQTLDPGTGGGPDVGRRPNHLRRLRVERMMSKAELARRSGLSSLTVDRIERGYPCRMDTMRKILEALGFSPSQRADVFPAAEAT